MFWLFSSFVQVTSLLRPWWISWGIKIVASTWRACSWRQEAWCQWFPVILRCQECTISQLPQTRRGNALHSASAAKNPHRSPEFQVFCALFWLSGLFSSRSSLWNTSSRWRRRLLPPSVLKTLWKRNRASKASLTANTSCLSNTNSWLPSLTPTRFQQAQILWISF